MSPLRVVVWLAALAAIGATARLGLWQLDRAAQKEALQQALEAQRQRPALAPAEWPRDARAAAALQHRRVTAQGEWLAARTVYLDNRVLAGRAGFHVLTPLRLEHGAALLVQRGWVARDAAERTRIVLPPPPAGLQTVTGRLALAPSRMFDLAPGGSGPIRQNLELEAFGQETGLSLLPWVLVQEDGDAPVADGLVRRWPAPALGADKNRAYAAQWFGLAALFAALLIWFQLIRPAIEQRKHHG